MDHRSNLPRISRKPLATRNTDINSHPGVHSRFRTTPSQNYAGPRTHTRTSHVVHPSTPPLPNKPLPPPPPPPTIKNLANPTAQMLRPSSTRFPNPNKHTPTPIRAQNDRDLLPSQRLRRNGDMLPSMLTQQFTKNALERVDSGVGIGARYEALSGGKQSVKPWQSDRRISFDVGAQGECAGTRGMGGEIGCVENGVAEDEAVEDGPSTNFDDILREMGKGRCVPTALQQ